MTANKYVKNISRHLHCGSKRKKDIQKQLMADIEERIARGESIEDAISQMGTVQEIADSFNENISPTEQKRHRRTKLLKISASIAIIAAIAIFLICQFTPRTHSLSTNGIFLRNKVEVALTQTIRLLDDENYAALQKMATAQMTQHLNKSTIDAAKMPISTNWGRQKAMGTIYIQEVIQMNEHYIISQVNVTYENASVTYTITFDDDMKIAGLYIK